MDKSEWSVWCPLNLMRPVMLENIFEEQVRKDCINTLSEFQNTKIFRSAKERQLMLSPFKRTINLIYKHI